MPTGVWLKSSAVACKECGGDFFGKGPNQIYCSVKCRRKAKHWRYLREPKARTIGNGAYGTIAELAVCQDLLSKGLQVFRAVAPDASCDILAFNDKGMWRIESKCARYEECKTEPGVYRLCFGLKREKNPSADVLALFSPQGVSYFSHRLKTYVKSTEAYAFWTGAQAPEPFVRVMATACPSGHPYDEPNTRRLIDGSRICRTCQRDYQRARRLNANQRKESQK